MTKIRETAVDAADRHITAERLSTDELGVANKRWERRDIFGPWLLDHMNRTVAEGGVCKLYLSERWAQYLNIEAGAFASEYVTVPVEIVSWDRLEFCSYFHRNPRLQGPTQTHDTNLQGAAVARKD